MVRVCAKTYDATPTESLTSIFCEYETAGLTLDHFQKYAIEAIEAGHHILVTAHTGSGKTLPAEYAIKKFCGVKSDDICDVSRRRRVIYTAPIKSLSNQKYHEFSRKYPATSFGIMTGDIKANSEADCVIMTTEILRNALYLRSGGGSGGGSGVAPMTSASEAGAGASTDATSAPLSFEFNPDEIACVIFDEVHYINDPDRGRVWEEVFMRLPSHIQCVMLSATIDRPEAFAEWVQSTTGREVWVAGTDIRVVPLIHYSYFTMSTHNYRDIKDKAVQSLVDGIDNKLIILKDATGCAYNHGAVETLQKVERSLRIARISVKRSFVLNRIVSSLKSFTMLPAICFVFSRRSAEDWAEEIEHGLFNVEDPTEKTFPSIVEREAREILRKMPNHREYMVLPEYHKMMRLLQKGIAVHHSGVLPVLREMIELLFARGFIKLLFATETFAVGVNMPTKTVMFTALSKFDGRSSFRNLASHEYTQMAGRAGRRGLDTIGHVIHLNNLFEVPTHTEYQMMLSGKPQTFVSRFKIDSSLILRVVSQLYVGSSTSSPSHITLSSIVEFIQRSTIAREVSSQYDDLLRDIERTTKQMSDIQLTLLGCGLDDANLAEYDAMMTEYTEANGRRRDRIQKQLQEFQTTHTKDDPTLKFDDIYVLFKKQKVLEKERTQLLLNAETTHHYIQSITEKIIDMLIDGGYMIQHEEAADMYQITRLGLLAAKIQEIPGMAVAKMLNDRVLHTNPTELASILSMFTEVRVRDEDSIDSRMALRYVDTPAMLETIEKQLSSTENLELTLNQPYDAEKYKYQYNIYDAIYEWCGAKTEAETRAILAELEKYGIFAGEFVKAILKIQNIVRELSEAAELIEDLELKETLSKIPDLLLKFIATNQSLYV